VAVCDGLGTSSIQNDDSDVPHEENTCVVVTCVAGLATRLPSRAGATCSNGGKLCDGTGNCVACNADQDCTTGHCETHTCVDANCLDKKKDGTETDVDCGGACAPCADAKMCTLATDCVHGVCNAGLCAAPSCTDGTKNGVETDVDCGGDVCPPCAGGKACLATIDCATGTCSNNVCIGGGCADDVKDGKETDVDCGGGACPTCGTGKKCAVSGDCDSGVCTSGHCVAPSCTDQVKNGLETDVDCGGTCPSCAPGKKCNGNTDCSTGLCAAGTCSSGSCSDKARNGQETDVDCGGPMCPACPLGDSCAVDTDCAHGLLCSAGKCVGAMPTTGLVAYYSFDGDVLPTVKDSSPNHNHGTAASGVVAVTGQIGSAYQIGGGCITVPNSTSLDQANGHALTMMAWFDATTACTGDHGTILDKQNAYDLSIACSGAVADELVCSNQGGSQCNFEGSAAVSLGAWHHYAVTWDGTNVVHYVDGALVSADTRALSGAFGGKNLGAGLGLGCHDVNSTGTTQGGDLFAGKID
jgi:hypothetical protein